MSVRCGMRSGIAMAGRKSMRGRDRITSALPRNVGAATFAEPGLASTRQFDSIKTKKNLGRMGSPKIWAGPTPALGLKAGPYGGEVRFSYRPPSIAQGKIPPGVALCPFPSWERTSGLR